MTDQGVNAIQENAALAQAIAAHCTCVRDWETIAPLCPACQLGHDPTAIKRLIFSRRIHDTLEREEQRHGPGNA